MTLLSLFVLGCASPTYVGDPVGMPLEIDAGSYNVRANNVNGAVVAVLVVTGSGSSYTEDWYLSPAGASGTYAPFVRPGSANPAVTLFYQYKNANSANPPTDPLPAANPIKWRHAVTKL